MEADSGGDFGFAPPTLFQDLKGRPSASAQTPRKLEVFVIFTDPAGTLAGLRMVEGLTDKLEARLHLLMLYEVPYRLPITEPAVRVEFLEGQVRKIALHTDREIEAHVCLCRDRRRNLELLMEPHSLIVVGGKKRWWRTAAQKLARDLQRDGHHVIFAELR